jgi:ethanolamine ammonia-lyase small subunit
MHEDQIRKIVQAVISQMTVGEKEAEQEKPEGKPEPVIKQQAKQQAVSPENVCAPNNETDDEDLEDLAAVDLQKEILVPEPCDRAALEYFKQTTPARIGVWRCGTRPLTRTLLRFRADHATAQDAVFKEISEDALAGLDLVRVQSAVKDQDEYLTRPDLGKTLPEEELEKIRRECPAKPDVQIIIADGLSTTAVEANLADILPALKQGLASYNLKTGRDILVKFGRVDIMDVIGRALEAEVVVLLVGERPGLGTSESMSAYMVYKPGPDTVVADHTVVSNIHKGGTPPAEAGAHLATVVKKIYDAKASGVKLTLQ